MTEQSSPAAAGSPEPIRPRRGRRWLFVTTVALVAALTGAMATRALGQYGPPGWGHMHGGPWFMRGPLSAAEIEDRVVYSLSSLWRSPQPTLRRDSCNAEENRSDEAGHEDQACCAAQGQEVIVPSVSK